jgi:hypothetical protein
MSGPVRRQGLLSRADLVEALAAGDEARVGYIAGCLGLQPQEPEFALSQAVLRGKVRSVALSAGLATAIAPPGIYPADLAPVPFWQPLTLERIGDERRQEAPLESEGPILWTDRPPPARFQPLASQRALQPRLHRALQHRHLGKKLDVPRIVRAIGQGRVLRRLPL